MRTRYLLWQGVAFILVLLIFGLFAPPVFAKYLQYSSLALSAGLLLGWLLPLSWRRHFGISSWTWDVAFPVIITLVSAVLRVRGNELHLEYLLPARMALLLAQGRGDRAGSEKNDIKDAR